MRAGLKKVAKNIKKTIGSLLKTTVLAFREITKSEMQNFYCAHQSLIMDITLNSLCAVSIARLTGV